LPFLCGGLDDGVEGNLGDVSPEVVVRYAGQFCLKVCELVSAPNGSLVSGTTYHVADCGPKQVQHLGPVVAGLGAVEEHPGALVDDYHG